MQLLSRIVIPLLTVTASLVSGRGTRSKHQHPPPYCDKGYEFFMEHEGVNKTVTMMPWGEAGYMLIPNDGNSSYGVTTVFNVDQRKKTRLSTMIDGKQFFLNPYAFDAKMTSYVLMWTEAMWGAYRWRIKDDGTLAMYGTKAYNKAWQVCPINVDGKLQDVIFRTDADVNDNKPDKFCKKATKLTAKCHDWREKQGKDTTIMEPSPVKVGET